MTDSKLYQSIESNKKVVFTNKTNGNNNHNDNDCNHSDFEKDLVNMATLSKKKNKLRRDVNLFRQLRQRTRRAAKINIKKKTKNPNEQEEDIIPGSSTCDKMGPKIGPKMDHSSRHEGGTGGSKIIADVEKCTTFSLSSRSSRSFSAKEPNTKCSTEDLSSIDDQDQSPPLYIFIEEINGRPDPPRDIKDFPPLSKSGDIQRIQNDATRNESPVKDGSRVIKAQDRKKLLDMKSNKIEDGYITGYIPSKKIYKKRQMPKYNAVSSSVLRKPSSRNSKKRRFNDSTRKLISRRSDKLSKTFMVLLKGKPVYVRNYKPVQRNYNFAYVHDEHELISSLPNAPPSENFGLLLLNTELKSIKSLLEKEKLKNDDLSKKIQSLQYERKDIEIQHTNEIIYLKKSHGQKLQRQDKEIQFLQHQKTALTTELDELKSNQKEKWHQMKSLEDQYKALRRAHDNMEEEIHDRVEGIYQNIVQPIKLELKVKDAVIHKLNQQLEWKKKAHEDLYERKKLSEKNLDDVTNELTNTKLELEKLREEYKMIWKKRIETPSKTQRRLVKLSKDLDWQRWQKSRFMKELEMNQYPYSPYNATSPPTKKDISNAIASNNWKLINLESIVNQSLQFYLNTSSNKSSPNNNADINNDINSDLNTDGSSSTTQWINETTLKSHCLNEFSSHGHHDYWHASLSINDETWDPSSPEEQFIIPGRDFIGMRGGKYVYRSKEAAMDAVFFFVLQDIDPGGLWMNQMSQLSQLSRSSCFTGLTQEDDNTTTVRYCLLRKEIDRKGTRWMALIRKDDQIYLVNIREAGKWNKPILICDRRLKILSQP